MSNYYSSKGLVGILVPFPWLDEAHRSATASSLSSLSTVPDRPIPAAASDGLALAHGTWATVPSSGRSYDLRIQQGGHVGYATWGWKADAEASTSARGHGWPTYARRMCMSLARANDTAARSDMVTLPSGRVCIVQGVRQAGTTPEIRAGYYDGEALVGGTAGDEIVVVTQDTAHAAYEGWDIGQSVNGRPSIAWWAEEQLVLIAVPYLSPPGGATQVGQVAIYQSTDGAAYTLRTRAALVEPWRSDGTADTSHSTYDNVVLRQVGGSWVLLSCYVDSATNRKTEQWAGTSPDHLSLVERTTIACSGAADGMIQVQAAGDGDGLIVVGAGYDVGGASTVDLHAWRLGSAWQPLSEAERVNLTTNTGTPIAGSYPAACIDPDGTCWAVYLDTTANLLHLVYSLDRGDTWLPAGYHPLEQPANANLQYLSLSHYRGGLILSYAADNGGHYYATAQLRSYLLVLGGWDNVPLPAIPTISASNGRIGFGRAYATYIYGVADSETLSWFPPWDPVNTSPAGVSTGAAPTLAVPDGADPYASYIDAGAGSYMTWTLTSATYDTTGIIVETDAHVQTIGTSVIADNELIRVRLQDSGGTNKIDVSIRADATTFELYDHAAGAVKTTVALAGTTRRQYRLAVRKDATGSIRCAMYYRIPGEQVWTQYTTTLATIGGLLRTVRQGAVATNGQTIRIYRTEFVGTIGPAGPRDITRALNVANLLGRRTSPRPTPISGGLMASWRRGPFHPGDAWTLGATAKYPPALVGPRDYPSPTDRWRSSADNVVADWVWEPDGGKFTTLPSPLLGMLVYGDGVETVTLAGRNAAGVYVSLITATPGATIGSGLRYVAVNDGAGVTGGALRPDSSGSAASRPWRIDELVGGWVRISATGHAYRITGNTPGFWGPSGGVKPTIYVSGWDTTEATTGDIIIYPPVSMHVSAELSPTTAYDRFRLRIAAAANTVEGRYELKVVVGSIYVPGRRWSYGRTPSRGPIARGVETPGGRSFYDAGQPIRAVDRIAWADAFGTRNWHEYNASTGPDGLVLASGASHPLSLLTGVHRDLAGILEQLNGPARTMVLLPRVEPQLTAWATSDPERWLYGRITSELTTPRPYGDEGASEDVTISEITVTGEV